MDLLESRPPTGRPLARTRDACWAYPVVPFTMIVFAVMPNALASCAYTVTPPLPNFVIVVVPV